MIDACAGERVGEIVDSVAGEVPLLDAGEDEENVGDADEFVEGEVDGGEKTTFAQLDRQPRQPIIAQVEGGQAERGGKGG